MQHQGQEILRGRLPQKLSKGERKGAGGPRIPLRMIQMIHGLMFISVSALPEARAVQDPRAARDELSYDTPAPLRLSPPREHDGIRDRKLTVGSASSSFQYTFDILSTSSVRK